MPVLVSVPAPHKTSAVFLLDFCIVITSEELEHWEGMGLTLGYLTALKLNNNPSQLDAINQSLTTTGFTMVQGPPGTGKTSTVLGILNSFHIREYNKYYRMACEIFLGEEGIRCRNTKNPMPW